MRLIILSIFICMCSMIPASAQTVWDQIARAKAKPWTFWYWMYGAVSDEGIRMDLQGMKDAGFNTIRIPVAWMVATYGHGVACG